MSWASRRGWWTTAGSLRPGTDELPYAMAKAGLNAMTLGLAGAWAPKVRANLVLPGGIYVSFSGHSVSHADGRQLQRVGVQPHIKAEPTLKGVREGRDEVLEAAVKFLDSSAKH